MAKYVLTAAPTCSVCHRRRGAADRIEPLAHGHNGKLLKFELLVRCHRHRLACTLCGEMFETERDVRLSPSVCLPTAGQGLPTRNSVVPMNGFVVSAADVLARRLVVKYLVASVLSSSKNAHVASCPCFLVFSTDAYSCYSRYRSNASWASRVPRHNIS